jgi:hypothetical protein
MPDNGMIGIFVYVGETVMVSVGGGGSLTGVDLNPFRK